MWIQDWQAMGWWRGMAHMHALLHASHFPTISDLDLFLWSRMPPTRARIPRQAGEELAFGDVWDSGQTPALRTLPWHGLGEVISHSLSAPLSCCCLCVWCLFGTHLPIFSLSVTLLSPLLFCPPLILSAVFFCLYLLRIA